MAESKPTLGYWFLRGLGQPIRFLVAYLGLDINEKRYAGFEEWQAEKLKLGLDFPNLPYLIQGDLKITESRAIIKHLARGSALQPASEKDVITCDMVENVLWDIWFALLRRCNYDLPALNEYYETDTPKKVGYLETFLQKKKFILGDKISYVDFLLYEMLVHFTTFDAAYLEKYPALTQFKKSFEELPAIAKYMQSKDYVKGPCINPRAKLPF